MIPEFTAATAAITAVGQAAKLIGTVVETSSDLKSKQAIAGLQNGILDLQAKVFAAQVKYQELADEKRETEQKLRALENWESEAARYRLTALVPGILVYEMKPDQSRGEPSHYICPQCFERKRKSILHHPSADDSNYFCHECRFNIDPEPPAPMHFSGGSY